MSNLYELTGQYLELLEIASDETIDQQMINDTLEGIDFEIEEQADYCAKIIRMLEGQADMLDKEIKRITDRKTVVKNNIVSIKKNLENTMLLTGKRKIKTDLFNFNIQKNPASVVIDDDTEIPKEYWIEQEPKLDKKSLSAFLKENEVPWAHLSQTESLRIR